MLQSMLEDRFRLRAHREDRETVVYDLAIAKGGVKIQPSASAESPLFSVDREKGVMTLTGNLPSQDLKSQAENLAKQAAPDYTIADEIGVRPPDVSQAGSVASNLDSAIEDNFKASIKSHENLNDQSIEGSAKNGTLVLKGTVKTAAQRKEAETLAKHIPNVQQVVNELEVKPSKHSTTNS